jgi:cell wall-associated NlpC family hydrolase
MRRNYLCFSVFLLCGCAAPQPSPRSPELVFQALATAGVPYRRGGESPETGFDCSGLVAHVYKEAFGIRLPHNAREQSRVGKHITVSGLEPGDLVFYNTERRPYSHVGIYLGDHRFIHAPKPGSSVRIEDMRAAYWSRRFDGARRVIE